MAPKKKTPAKSSTPGVPVKSVTPAKKIAKSPKTTVSEPKTLFCPRCSMGPMNKAGLAMHEARWCKKKDRPAAPPGNLGDLADDDDVTIAELSRRLKKASRRAKKGERVSEEKTLFCDKCKKGPMNKAGLAMHQGRWCKGPGAVLKTPKAAAAKPAAGAKTPKTPEPKTLTCAKCGKGPMNKAGMAMHQARWCKPK